MSKLPPITQALADAVNEAREAALENQQLLPPGHAPGGLVPIGTRALVHASYQGAAGTDLHIQLCGGPEACALYLALVQAGADVPITILTADVIMGSGSVAIHCDTEDGQGTWWASIGDSTGRPQQWGWQRS